MGVDETQQGTTPDDVETGIIADSPRNVETPQAWSHDDAETGAAETEHVPTSWRSVYARAGLFLFSGVVLAVVVAGVGLTLWASELPAVRPSEPVAASTPAPTAAPSPLAPVETSAAPPVTTTAQLKASPRDVYLSMLNQGGVSVGNLDGIDSGVHNICAYVAGHGVPAAVNAVYDEALRINSPLNYRDAGTVVHAAVTAYCPQYGAGAN